MIKCRVCGTESPEGSAYCESCGADFSGTTENTQGAGTAPTPGRTQEPPASIGEKQLSHEISDFVLVEVTTGEQIRIPSTQEAVLGREDPASGTFPDIDLTRFDSDLSVSRKHAKITLTSGAPAIQDLNSVNFTFVNNEKIQPNAVRRLVIGDEIRLGRVKLRFSGRAA